jgi:hypothetical protein
VDLDLSLFTKVFVQLIAVAIDDWARRGVIGS